MTNDRVPLAWIALGATLSVALSLALGVLVLGSCRGESPTDTDPSLALFEDDFESGLGQWTGRPALGHHAQLVPDPVGEQGTVVRFSETVASGDIFSLPIPIQPDSTYVLSFDYLGIPETTVPPGGLGGFIGIADDVSTFVLAWIAGTQPDQVTNLLVDDGTWHSYSYSFVPSAYFNPTGGTLHIMLEDFEGSGAYAMDAAPGDAYFDNIRVVRGAP